MGLESQNCYLQSLCCVDGDVERRYGEERSNEADAAVGNGESDFVGYNAVGGAAGDLDEGVDAVPAGLTVHIRVRVHIGQDAGIQDGAGADAGVRDAGVGGVDIVVDNAAGYMG